MKNITYIAALAATMISTQIWAMEIDSSGEETKVFTRKWKDTEFKDMMLEFSENKIVHCDNKKFQASDIVHKFIERFRENPKIKMESCSRFELKSFLANNNFILSEGFDDDASMIKVFRYENFQQLPTFYYMCLDQTSVKILYPTKNSHIWTIASDNKLESILESLTQEPIPAKPSFFQMIKNKCHTYRWGLAAAIGAVSAFVAYKKFIRPFSFSSLFSR